MPGRTSPWAGHVCRLWTSAVLGAGVMFFIYMALLMGSLRTVHAQKVAIPFGAAPGAPEGE